MKVLVSIHDVAPPTRDSVHALWDLCTRFGVVPALLVVPNWHGLAPIGRDPGFLDWLHRRVDDGANLFLHGERHDEVETSRAMQDRVGAIGRTAGEAEFLALSYDAARAKIERGLATLRQHRFEPIGFVAPAWLYRAETEKAVADAGLAISENDRSIVVHQPRRRIPSPAIRWSTRTAVRAYVSIGVALAARLAMGKVSTLRIALHPGDARHRATCRSVEQALKYWTANRTISSYADL